MDLCYCVIFAIILQTRFPLSSVRKPSGPCRLGRGEFIELNVTTHSEAIAYSLLLLREKSNIFLGRLQQQPWRI